MCDIQPELRFREIYKVTLFGVIPHGIINESWLINEF